MRRSGLNKKKGIDKLLFRRAWFVAGLFFVFFTIIAYQSFQLSVAKGVKLKKLSRGQASTHFKTQSPRGIIEDTSGRALAISVNSMSIAVDPFKVEKPYVLARFLSKKLNLPYRKVLKKIKRKGRFVWIKRLLDPPQVSSIQKMLKEGDSKVEGLRVVRESKRYYPNKHLAAHVLGFVNLDGHGMAGVEKKLEKILAKKTTKKPVYRDAFGDKLIIKQDLKNLAKEVLRVRLTLDTQIQLKLEDALAKIVKKRKPLSVMGIVVNPGTGEILALASFPDYNPNIVKKSSAKSRRNRVIADVYEPGSTFKAITFAAALEENVVLPQTKMDCEGGAFRVGRATIHDDHPHGVISARDAFKFSSNICTGKLAEMIGIETFYSYIKGFGFGTKTGLELSGEARGLLYPYKRWSRVMGFNVAFGQGLAVTPLQLAMAVSAIANGGILYRPQIIKAIYNQDGKVLKSYNPEKVRRVISKKTAETLREIMISVTEPGGTAPRARISGYEVGGKTGTAQKVDPEIKGYSPTKRVGSFIGIAPAKNPRVVTLIVVDEPQGIGYGGVVAAPAFKEVTQFALHHLEVKPNYKKGLRPVRFAKRKTIKKGVKKESWKFKRVVPGRVPNVVGLDLRKSVELLMKLGYMPRIEGSGSVKRQKPRPGVLYQKGKTVFLKLEEI